MRLTLQERAAIVETILLEHLDAVARNIKSPALRRQISHQLTLECDDLFHLIQHKDSITDSVWSPMEDEIVSKGEKLSSLFMATVLQDNGVEAKI